MHQDLDSVAFLSLIGVLNHHCPLGIQHELISLAKYCEKKIIWNTKHDSCWPNVSLLEVVVQLKGTREVKLSPVNSNLYSFLKVVMELKRFFTIECPTYALD